MTHSTDAYCTFAMIWPPVHAGSFLLLAFCSVCDKLKGRKLNDSRYNYFVYRFVFFWPLFTTPNIIHYSKLLSYFFVERSTYDHEKVKIISLFVL